MVDQIYYSNWSNELKEGHENYWSDISDISVMIGNDLIGPYQMNYYLSKDDDYLKQLSSIAVLQTKEKFGEVRVYCRLGCETIIQNKYSKHVSETVRKNKEWSDFLKGGVKPKNYSKWWEKSMRDKYPLKPEEASDFWQKEIFSDIMHYRNTYLKYIRLFPHYEMAIRSGADHSEYLIDSKEEAIKYIEKEKLRLEESAKVYNWPEDVYNSSLKNVKKTEEILSKIHKIE